MSRKVGWLLLFALSIFWGECFAQDPASTVTIDSGTLKGASDDGIVTFKGIPFAAPPVGPLRWRAPQSVAAWSGVRDATVF